MVRKLIVVGILLVLSFVIYRTFFYQNVRNANPDGTAIIAFGDSLTAGVGAGPGEDYPSQLEKLCNCQIINKGISGDTTAGGLSRLQRDVLAHDPKIVILGLGGNDLLQKVPPAQAFENLRQMISHIQNEGALVILLGIKGLPFADTYGSQYKKLAKETGCLFVPDILGGILTNARLKADQIHPNGAGYKIIAERVWKALKPHV